MAEWRIIEGDCRVSLRSLPAGSVHTVVTSPPYFGLRDYGTGAWEGGDPACEHMGRAKPRNDTTNGSQGGHFADGTRGTQPAKAYAEPLRDQCSCGARRVDEQIGLEATPDEFVAALVAVFREVRRVLRDDGTVWLNLGDSYNSSPPGNKSPMSKSGLNGAQTSATYRERLEETQQRQQEGRSLWSGAKPKDLIGIPWMVAFALRADGWYLRSDIIWAKPNPMPESVTDRPTKAHEYLFLLSKGPRYFYDADAIREANEHPDRTGTNPRLAVDNTGLGAHGSARNGGIESNPAGRNKRSVWTVATQPYAGAHFATFPPDLVEPCARAGAPARACGECGAPWVRVVERSPMVVRATPKREAWQASDEHARTQMGGTMLEPAVSRTVGFAPSCSHYDDRYRAENPRARGSRKRAQRAATGDWWRRTRARPANPAWPSVPGVVLDPFAGAGTAGLVALRQGRAFIGCELNPAYAAMARERIEADVRLGFRSPQGAGAVMAGQTSIFDVLEPG